MKTRVMTALAIILVVALPVAFGGWLLELLALFILLSTAFEWMHVRRDFKSWPVYVYPLTVVLVILTRFIPEHYTYIIYALGVCFFFALPVFVENFSLPDSYYCLTYFILFSLIYHAIGYLVAEHMYLWTIVFATYGSDTGAWFVGSYFGKHKMNPRISPKKSWEGFFGGIVFGFLLSLIISFLYADSLNGYLNTLLCCLCQVVAELGDLCFSAIKRSNKVKDFSNLLPGHGGVLDRVDSLMMNILLFGILHVLLIV